MEHHFISFGIATVTHSHLAGRSAGFLRSIHFLLCTTTNATPHKCMFNFERRSSTGTALPVWLCEPGEVLLKQFGGRSKYDPIVEVVELLEANLIHARIRHPDGWEDSIALRHLARFPHSDRP